VEINGNATTLLSSVENLRTAATSECATVVSLFIASALEAANRWRDAAALFGRAAELAREVDAIEIEWRALSCQGQCLHRAGGDRSAWKAFQAAMDVIDGQWYRLAGAEDVYRQFFADKWELYDNAVLCCLRLGYRAEALECCERGKVRYLGDLVARRHLGKVSRRKRTRHPFWRELAEAMPVRVRRHEQDVATGLVEIVAVDPEAAEAASDSSALIPVQWAALVASEDHPELQAVSRMVAVLWRMAREVTRSDDDELRDAIQQMDAVMARLLSLLESGVWPADRNEQSGISRDYRSAVGTLHSQSRRLLDEGSYWDVAEVFNSSSGDDWLVVIHAIREPLNVVLHNTPVFGTYCEGQRDKDAPTLVARSTSEHRGRSGSRLRTEFIESRLARLEQSKWSDTLALARGEVATFADIADTVRGTPDFAHVEFCVTQEGTHAWIIHSVGRSNDGEAERRLGEDRIRVIDLPDVSLEKLNTHLPWKADVVPSNMNKTLKWLSRDLWQPIDTYLQLQKIRRVRIVPHRGLHLIPFAALKSVRNKYVADDYEISLQPGASIAKICRRREPQRKYSGLTAIANPNGDLEYAETEVDSVVSWYSNESVEIVRGQDASLSRFRSMQLRETHHHAGHARYEWGDPLASGVCFADGSLTLGDLFDCTEPANDWTHTRRVVLSACETAVTDPADLADECLGLATGFLFAGVDEVVASLWPVDDLATSLLMDRFHRALHAQDGDAGPSSALALKQAQDWLRRLTWSVIRQQAPEECQSASDSQSRNLSGIPEVTGQSCCDSSTDNPHARPFQHPYFWAGFAVWSL
jgi:CHAT domain-containing protein